MSAESSLPRARSGSPLVLGMLVLLALILWWFDSVVGAFGPPDPAMPIRFESAHAEAVEVLVRAAGEPGWSVLFGGAEEPALAAAEPRQVHLLTGEQVHWQLLLRAGDRVLGELPVEARSDRQLGVAVDREGAVFLREGEASLPLAKQAHLQARRAPAPGPDVPGPPKALDLPVAPDSWALGRPRGEP